MTALRRVIVLAALTASLLVLAAGLALAGEAQDTTTTTIGEGPTEITVPTTDPNVLGPEAEELPDTGAGSELVLIVAGAVLIVAGAGSAAVAFRR